MKTPPEMLSPKDCSYISDLLETILTLAKKADCYSTEICDKQIAEFAKQYYETLKSEYSIVNSYLKGSINS